MVHPRAYSLPQFWDSDHKPFDIKSPDGTKSFHVDGKRSGKGYPDDEWSTDFSIRYKGKRLPGEVKHNSSPEILWSPDSKAIGLTSTDGGLVGEWNVRVYYLNDLNFEILDVTKEVKKALAASFPPCVSVDNLAACSPETRDRVSKGDVSWVNVSAIQWITGSQKLFVITGVPPSSFWGRNMGKTKGYGVEVPSGRILETLTKSQYLAIFKSSINTISP